MRNLSVPILLGSALLVSHVDAGKESSIDLAVVPESIRSSAERAMPEVKFQSANIEEEVDGTKVFELQGLLPDGRHVEVDVFNSGGVEEIEVEFKLDHVPGAVMKSIKQKLPGFQPTYIEASHSDSMKVVQYEFAGKVADQEIDLEVSADGRKVVVADQ